MKQSTRTEEDLDQFDSEMNTILNSIHGRQFILNSFGAHHPEFNPWSQCSSALSNSDLLSFTLRPSSSVHSTEHQPPLLLCLHSLQYWFLCSQCSLSEIPRTRSLRSALSNRRSWKEEMETNLEGKDAKRVEIQRRRAANLVLSYTVLSPSFVLSL